MAEKENEVMDEPLPLDILFTSREAMGAIRVISLAMGRDGGLVLEPDESKAVSKILDEALVSLISISEKRPELS